MKFILAVIAVVSLFAGATMIANGVGNEKDAAAILERARDRETPVLQAYLEAEAVSGAAYRTELMGIITLLLGVVAMGFGSIPDMRPKPQVAQQPNVQPPQPPQPPQPQHPPQYPQPPQG